MAATSFTGCFVFYAIPDDKARTHALTYAANLGNTPAHITKTPFIPLYQANFKDAPRAEIDLILDDIRPILLGASFRLHSTIDVSSGGAKYLRWLVEHNARMPLHAAHSKTLRLAKWLDPIWHQGLITYLTRSNPPPSQEEKSNIVDFGNAHVNNLFEPSILLAIGGPKHNFRNPRQSLPCTSTIQRVGFAPVSYSILLGQSIAERP